MLRDVTAPGSRGAGGGFLSFQSFLVKLTDVTTIPVADAKARFSELLDRVRQGERFLVLRHGRPAAALVPAAAVAPMETTPVGLAAVAGTLAEWADLDAVVEGIYAARERATDRPAPPLD
jgi:prevent-host-death family protein